MESTSASNRTIPNNETYIIIHVNEKGMYVLIDAAMSGERNVIKKEAEKIQVYKDLLIESQHTWNVKAKVIPVIKEATVAI
jgi:hypothetical protein